MKVAIEAMLGAAGYPTPPTVEDAVRMLLGEIESARTAIDRAHDEIDVLRQDLDTQTTAAFANQRVADNCYRDGYLLGRRHGYVTGRQATACERCTYPPEEASS